MYNIWMLESQTIDSALHLHAKAEQYFENLLCITKDCIPNLAELAFKAFRDPGLIQILVCDLAFDLDL